MAKKIDPKALRAKLKMNQTDFWRPLGVTQSGGCRYENGRAMPKPVRLLLELMHGRADIVDLKTGKLAGRV